MRFGLLIYALACLALPAQARDPAVVREWRRDHPCPSTGKTTGSCPGWIADHRIPICLGLEYDVPANLQWQEIEASHRKDKLEWEVCRFTREMERGQVAGK